MPRPASDSEVYCWLKQCLEPAYNVTTCPDSDYFSEHRYHYQIHRNGCLVDEMRGDFRHLSPGQLIQAAEQVLAKLSDGHSVSRSRQLLDQPDRVFPIASRVPPKTGDNTWFSSGRAAFAWLIGQHSHLQTIHIPTYLCWSLINVLQDRFPHIDVRFYSMDRRLRPQFPRHVGSDAAVLVVHYFGRRSSIPHLPSGTLLLEDSSHMPVSLVPASRGYSFGSLRKVYRTASGGFLSGAFNPVYETGRNQDAWLRRQATDWKDLREAENMTDRDWKICDIESHSLATVLTDDDHQIRAQRSNNQRQLEKHLTVGEHMLRFEPDESPLLHNCLLPTTTDRDSLRAFLAARDIYCSIHWPTHPVLMGVQDEVDCTDAQWIADHVLSFPVSQHYDEEDMSRICEACDDWQRAGSIRFGMPAA